MDDEISQMTLRFAALVALGLYPAVAFCSDPTGLFVLFFGMPAVGVGAFLVWLSYSAPRFGLGLTPVFLLAHVPIVLWAQDVGYMAAAGGWLYVSAALGTIAIFTGIVRIIERRPSEAPGYSWNCHACSKSNPGTAVACLACGCPAKASAREASRYSK